MMEKKGLNTRNGQQNLSSNYSMDSNTGQRKRYYITTNTNIRG